jgi:hypothetical protein
MWVDWRLRLSSWSTDWLFWLQIVHSLAWVLRILVRCVVRMKNSVRRSTSVLFHRFLGEVRRELMHRLSVVLHRTLGSYLRDAVKEGSADAFLWFIF